MPEICRFYGLIVAMFYNDHTPPHFHVRYGDAKAIIAIETLELLDGSLPPRALALTLEWAAGRRSELRRDWKLARDRAPLEPIAPLE